MSTATSTPTDALRAHSDRIAAIVDKLGAGTVAVLGRRGAIASGCVWRPGLVVTAAHVFRRTPAALTLVDGAGASLAATLVGIDSSTDLALFRLADERRRAPSPPVATGDAAPRARRPLRRSPSAAAAKATPIASAGIVNRVGGAVADLARRLPIDRLIRLDGGVYDGLSGAPVADARGAVIGVATAALSRSYGIVVPASTVSRVVDGAARQRPRRPALARHRRAAGAAARRRGARPAAGERRGLLVTSLARRRAGRARRPADRRHHRPRRRRDRRRPARPARGARRPRRPGGRRSSILRGGAPLELEVEVGEWPSERRCC